MAHLDVDLQGILTKLLCHESARIKATRGEDMQSILARLQKADLMPDAIATRVAHNLASLLAFEKEDDDVKETLKEAMSNSYIHQRKNGKGWSVEFIEKAHMEFTVGLIHDMCNEIDKQN